MNTHSGSRCVLDGWERQDDPNNVSANQISINNDCSSSNSVFNNFNMAGLRVEMARDTNRHVKKTLPPSLTGFPGEAEIKYFVKVTVVRPAFYKENYRFVRRSDGDEKIP